MLGAAAVAAGAVLCEALLFRALIDWGAEFLRPDQRVGMVAAVAGFLATLFLLEWSLTAGLLRAGRRFEMQLRLAILQKIPRLGDRYFHSRLVSDMADRSHSIHSVRTLPLLGSRFVQALVELVLTVAAIAWIDPDSGWIAAPIAVLVVALPFLVQPLLSERDLRFRAHAGALTRVVLDASLGLLPIRAHSAERAVRRQHESLLTEWGRAGLGLHDIERRVSTLQNVVGIGGAIGIVWLHSTQSTGVVPLLLAYWALRLPLLGQELTMVLRQYPARRNVMLRLLEPLGAPSEALAGAAAPASDPNLADGSGVALDLNNVSVRVAGHEILHEVNLSIPRGAHVAIVGASGSGKSTLVGLFLGWAGTLTGRVHLDGSPLDAARVMQLRGQTAWIDPAVQLWNRSLLENLIYGTADDRELPVMQAADEGGLHEVVERLPDGLRTRLGEGGGLLSGGEGQRVRYARSLLRSDTRLAILDEPFRGLDRDTRRQLLAGARRRWKNATMLCVTHDVAETLAFERILVVHDGRLVEDGDPRVLASQPGSHYASMLATEKAVHDDFWGAPQWRRLWLDRGTLTTQS
jgi:ATP-binding cassette subfamily B protein